MYAYTTGTLGTLQDTITYTYGNTAWKDQLTNYDGTAISYDASGNPTNWIGNLNTLTWNGRQLSSISMPNNQSINFKYNSDGIRTYKYFIDNDEMYLYQHDYMLEGSTIVGEKVFYNSYYEGMWTKYKYYYYDENGSPIGMGYEGKDYYFQKNILGDIEAIYQGSTKVVQYTYDACGNVLSVTGSLASTVGQENPFRYRGYYYDTETGLYYLQSRYYDPQVGRFINADDALFIDATGTLPGCNLYSYCENNPVMFVDPYGCWKINIRITDRLIKIIDGLLIVATLLVSGIMIAKSAKLALKVASWFSKKTIKSKLNNIALKCATVIFDSLHNVIYYFANTLPAWFKGVSITLISDYLMDLIDFSPAKIILSLIDYFDGDKKSGYIRW